jgi:peroxiredoxin family protein
MDQMDEKKKITMIVFSGDMDKAMAAFIIATGAAASGISVTMFFTFWGLQTIKKSVQTGRGFFGKMLGWMLKDIDSIGPSKMNFGGVGRWMFKKMMRSKNVAMLPELRQMAIELGVKMEACQMSMDVMEIEKKDLIDEVAEVVGVAAMLEEAQQSTFTMFI